MKWLLTISAGTDVARIAPQLERLGCTLESEKPVPMDRGEQVVMVEGPPDLPSRLSDADVPVVKASPSSELELY